MKSFLNPYINIKLSLMILGPGFILFGLLGLIFPEKFSTYVNGNEVHGMEELKVSILFIFIGIVCTVIRFVFMKDKKTDKQKKEQA